MKKVLELDPTSEYYRVCPYCKEPFMAHHQLQKFCPVKNDVPNYCKHRYKVLKQGADLILGGPVTLDPWLQSKLNLPKTDLPINGIKEIRSPELSPEKSAEPSSLPENNNGQVIETRSTKEIPIVNAKSANIEIINKLMGNLPERQFSFKEIDASVTPE
jgi:hypothetical protein